jgi:D-arabinose 1-dehydrogenase-like Zn-dependent alcohol dehydrogenase
MRFCLFNIATQGVSTRHFIYNHLIPFQIISSGLCGTDKHFLEGKNKVPFPVILGNQCEAR